MSSLPGNIQTIKNFACFTIFISIFMLFYSYFLTSQVVLVVKKNLPTNAGDKKTLVQSQEDPLEKEMLTHSSRLENPTDRGTW